MNEQSITLLNTSQVLRFLNLLSTNPTEIYTYGFFDRETGKPTKGYATCFGKRGDIVRDCQKLSKSATLHVVLNRTSIGRKYEHVESSRVLAVDLDRQLAPNELEKIITKFTPHGIVESSPGRHHLYWKIEDVNLVMWEKFQLGLAHYFNGDYALAERSKMLRSPGMARLTKSGELFLPEFIWMPETVRAAITLPNIIKVFPFIEETYQEAVRLKKKRVKALRKAIEKKDLSEIEAGEGRNATIYWAVKQEFSKFRPGVEAGTYDDAVAYARGLNETFRDGPLGESEFTYAARNGFKKGSNIREFYKNKYEAAMSEKYVNGEAHEEVFKYDYESNPFLKANRFGELSIIARITQRFYEKLCSLDGAVYAFNEIDHTWNPQTTNKSTELINFYGQVILDVLNDPLFIPTFCMDKEGQVIQSKRQRAEERFLSSRLPKSVISIVLNSTAIPSINKTDVERNAEILFVANGALDIVSGDIRDAEPGDYLLNRSNIVYDPYAECPKWEEFINEIFSANEEPKEMVRFIQELFGYSLTGNVNEQKVFCHYGTGANGKSKVLSALQKLMGDYATFIDPDEVVSKKGGAMKSFERFGAKIDMKRVAIVDDLDTASTWNDAFLKNATGSYIRARAEYERSREIVNRAKVHFGLNEAPSPQSETDGVIRRLCLIPYSAKFQHTAHKSNEIDANILKELSGILNWAIEGYKRVKEKGGIVYPEETKLAVEEYKQEYFKIEESVKKLFSAGEEWHPLPYLLKCLNTYLENEGESVRATADKLGGILSQDLRAQKERKTKKRVTHYRVKFLIPKEQVDNYGLIL